MRSPPPRSAFFFAVLLCAGCLSDGRLAGAELAAAAPEAVSPPLANAGPDEEILRGFPAELRGAASYHPSGRAFGARWEQVGGDRVLLSNPESLTPSFVAPLADQELEFVLRIDDGTHSTSDAVRLHVVAAPERVAPTVFAGADRVGSDQDEPSEADVLGPRTDPSIETVWEEIAITFSGARSASKAYQGPRVFRLTGVRDGMESAPDHWLLFDAESFSGEQAPRPSVLGPSWVEPGATFELDSRESTDSNGDVIAMRWEQLRGAPILNAAEPGDGTLTLEAPLAPQTLVFRGYARDGLLESEPAEIRILVRPRDRTEGLRLRDGQDLWTRPGREITLEAESTGGEGQLSFDWFQTLGVEAQVESDGGPILKLVAPEVAGDLAFAVRVSDHTWVSMPTVFAINVLDPEFNSEPQVTLCATQSSPTPGQVVTVVGRTIDPEGDALTDPEWQWDSSKLNLEQGAVGVAEESSCSTATPKNGGPEDSTQLSVRSFTMPTLDDPTRIIYSTCDSLGACAEAEVEFTP